MTELPVPPAALKDPNATEIARIWAAGGKQQVSLATELWNDPMAWGLMLVDLARHVANAYCQTEGRDPADVLRRIRAGLDAEWSSPTDAPKGRLMK
jgi:hypothetical protein